MSVGERIKSIRKARGVEQKELARAAGISAAYLSRIEGDERNCSVALLRRIADALNTPLSAFAPPDDQSEQRALDEVLGVVMSEHPEVGTYLRRIAGHTGELSDMDRRFLADHLKMALSQADQAIKRSGSS